MICCGGMGPMCTPVYAAMIDLKKEFKKVKFADFDFDHPDTMVIRNAPEANAYMRWPFTFYFKNG